jgi:hypothetical protein
VCPEWLLLKQRVFALVLLGKKFWGDRTTGHTVRDILEELAATSSSAIVVMTVEDSKQKAPSPRG